MLRYAVSMEICICICHSTALTYWPVCLSILFLGFPEGVIHPFGDETLVIVVVDIFAEGANILRRGNAVIVTRVYLVQEESWVIWCCFYDDPKLCK